jgi:TatD DNase family protein
LEKILIETDAPYLSPEPLRGQINYPQNIVYTLETIAKIKQLNLEILAKRIYLNSLTLFCLPS